MKFKKSRSRVSPLSTSSGRSNNTRSTVASTTSSSYNHYYMDEPSSSSSSSSLPTLSRQKLDEIAQALQLSVDVQPKRKCYNTNKRYKDCFVGSDAVDILQQLAGVETRKQALEVGRQIQSSLHLFQCVNVFKIQDELIDDERLFYRFTRNTTGASADARWKEIPNLEAKLKKFQKGVVLKDRFSPYRYATYKECFVGKEAVDLMMKYKMAATRAECVELGQIFQTKYNLFHCVTGDPNSLFEDDYFKFYRLLRPQQEKEKPPTFLEEIKPARYVIALSLIPACLTYYYFF